LSRKPRNRSIGWGYFQLLIRIITIAVICWLIFNYVFLITRCHGQGMFPAVKDGDLCVIFRNGISTMLRQKLSQDDVIAYKVDGRRYFGRVIAAAGDIVMLGDSVTVNGTPQSNEILFPTEAGGKLDYPYEVPEGTVFVMGDYRTNTVDSRDFGPIPLEDVEGKVITLLRRRGI